MRLVSVWQMDWLKHRGSGEEGMARQLVEHAPGIDLIVSHEETA